MITLALSVAAIFIIAGVVLGLAACGVASLGALIVIGFKIGCAAIPLLVGFSLIKWGLDHI